MHVRPILAIAAVCVTSTLTGIAAATAGTSASPTSAEPHRILDNNVSGTRAVRALGADLDAVAGRYGQTPDEFANLLRADSSLWLDPTGALHVKEPVPGRSTKSVQAHEPGPYPNSDTFSLHSRGGAKRTIFLDFDGGAVSGTAWNDFYGVPTTPQPAFDMNGDPATWSQAEHDLIQSVFQRVAEDFRPFDVDVTTEDPGPAALDRSSAADTRFGTRVLVTPSVDAATRTCGNACGGIAFLSIYNEIGSSYHQPAWVFAHHMLDVPKNIAEAASHEAGHNLGLFHDGTSTAGYYPGHHNWAPIMGVGYGEPLTQWSKGEYSDADNTQNDLAVIQSFGLSLRADDHGSGFATATALGVTRTAGGVIERRTDRDVFKFRRTCGGKAKITAKPSPNSPNLDIRLRLHNAGKGLLSSKNPPSGEATFDVATGLGAKVARRLPAGKYYLTLDGVGTLTPATGYSDYGSLGEYSVRISRCK